MEILGSPELLEILLAKEFTRELSISFSSLNKKMTNYSDLIHSCYVINRTSVLPVPPAIPFRAWSVFLDKVLLNELHYMMMCLIPIFSVLRKTEYTLNGKNYSESVYFYYFQSL